MSRFAFAVLLLPWAAGCTCGALDPAQRFACQDTSECAPDFVCSQGECVPAGATGGGGATGGAAGGGTGGGSTGGGGGQAGGGGGAVDGGGDADVDADRDGSPSSLDCNDLDPTIFPGAPELCANSTDDDCDRLTDCADPSCDALTCAAQATCVSSVCTAATEVLCADRTDNDGDLLIDCADPDCPGGARCDDGNLCSLNEACTGDGGCTGVPQVCATPQSICYQAVGVCSADAGCVYAPRNNVSCDDTLACTQTDRCSAGTCTGTPRTCGASPGACYATQGTCTEPAGTCVWAPLATGACNDLNACTLNDTCDGDGGCVGAPIVCTPPSQCHGPGACSSGACTFPPRTGQPCDGGTGTTATCSASYQCLASLFSYTPSNFTEAQVPTASAPDFVVSCDLTLTLNNNPSFSGSCAPGMIPFVNLTQPGGDTLTLFAVRSFVVTPGGTLTIQGNRAAAFAVLGPADIAGRIHARNTSSTTSCGASTGGNGSSGIGAGGGGFGSPGGTGGALSLPAGAPGGVLRGLPTLIPLLGGCSGGSAMLPGGAGGGALQLSVRDDLLISGSISAPGRGGQGGVFLDFAAGGGSGGGILLEARTVQLAPTAWLTANGGGGGEGTTLSSAGAAGADGLLTGNTPAAGGQGMGSQSGNGGNGGSSLAPAGDGTDSMSSQAGSGAGGGGVGRIRLNAAGSCGLLGGVSPPATSNGMPGCP